MRRYNPKPRRGPPGPAGTQLLLPAPLLRAAARGGAGWMPPGEGEQGRQPCSGDPRLVTHLGSFLPGGGSSPQRRGRGWNSAFPQLKPNWRPGPDGFADGAGPGAVWHHRGRPSPSPAPWTLPGITFSLCQGPFSLAAPPEQTLPGRLGRRRLPGAPHMELHCSFEGRGKGPSCPNHLRGPFSPQGRPHVSCWEQPRQRGAWQGP